MTGSESVSIDWCSVPWKGKGSIHEEGPIHSHGLTPGYRRQHCHLHLRWDPSLLASTLTSTLWENFAVDLSLLARQFS